MERIRSSIRTVSNFPKQGIEFMDITPLLANGNVFRETIEHFRERHKNNNIDMVVGIEARGFIFASALAYALGAGTCLVRKPGKLPHTVHQQAYELEYGSNAIEIHADAFQTGQRLLIIDDVLATGGTIAATTQLIQKHFDVEIAELNFLIELDFLNGRDKLPDLPIFSLLNYE